VPALVFQNVEKAYGSLRPLRVRDLTVPHGQITMLIGFDRPAAEVFVNLMMGAALPDKGEVITLERPTREIVDSAEWLAFADRFGIVSDRIVLLDAMTVAQNVAIAFDLALDPVPADVHAKVAELATLVGISEADLDLRVAEAPALLRSRICLARALAFGPDIVLLEHPTASLTPDEGRKYASAVRYVFEQRPTTVVGVLMDEAFAAETGGRLLYWQPATGEVRAPSKLAQLRRKLTSGR
jgi:ABC-type transporter Mla maintaining outer membrane lipid asymmetry ATPase subunit MlaF